MASQFHRNSAKGKGSVGSQSYGHTHTSGHGHYGNDVKVEARTALDMLEDETNRGVLSTGCAELDRTIGGGVRVGITEISGEAGVGKTGLALQMTLQVQLPVELGGLNGGALFIATEGEFPMARLKQLMDGFLTKHSWTVGHRYLDHIFIERVQTMDEQDDALYNRLPLMMAKHKEIKLIVLDSIAGLFRVDFGHDQTPARAEQLFRLSAHLKSLSAKYNCPVVVLNQVTDHFDGPGAFPHTERWAVWSSGRRVVPALGLAWASCINYRFFLSRATFRRAVDMIGRPSNSSGGSDGDTDERIERCLHVIWSPLLARTATHFIIQEDGIRGIPDAPEMAYAHHVSSSSSSSSMSDGNNTMDPIPNDIWFPSATVAQPNATALPSYDNQYEPNNYDDHDTHGVAGYRLPDQPPAMVPSKEPTTHHDTPIFVRQVHALPPYSSLQPPLSQVPPLSQGIKGDQYLTEASHLSNGHHNHHHQQQQHQQRQPPKSNHDHKSTMNTGDSPTSGWRIPTNSPPPSSSSRFDGRATDRPVSTTARASPPVSIPVAPSSSSSALWSQLNDDDFDDIPDMSIPPDHTQPLTIATYEPLPSPSPAASIPAASAAAASNITSSSTRIPATRSFVLSRPTTATASSADAFSSSASQMSPPSMASSPPSSSYASRSSQLQS